MFGTLILLALYFASCWQRWRVARHYGEKLRLMGLSGLVESWDHLRASPNEWFWKALIFAWIIAGVTTILIE